MVRILTLLVLFTLSGASMAQLSTKSKKAIEYYTEADNYRVRGQHPQAIELLEMAIEKDKNFLEAYYRLGLVYMSMKNHAEAIKQFERSLTLTEDIRKKKVIWYDLGESYLLSGKYKQATTVLASFVENENQNRQKLERAKLMLANAKFASDNIDKASKEPYHKRLLSDIVNCFAMQYFPVLTADEQELIFTRRLGNGGEHDEDLVISRKDENGNWTKPVSISDSINSVLNEGTCTISADGRKLIFTSCVGRKGYGSCDLYESRKIGDDWTEPENLGPNVNSYDWESQPTLSADGRTLYFISDRRGGIGRRDIWFSSLDENGQWSRAANLGAPVNTPYDEISPFIHVNDRVLYFSSNGQVGFGGYDILYSERDSTGSWTLPKNMGTPINDHEDQFSLYITSDGLKGYYSHEEFGESGYSAGKLYVIDIPESQRIKYRSNYVKGIVTDKNTRAKLGATIELYDLQQNKIVSQVNSDSVTGEYLMVLTQGSDYALYINKVGYLFQSLNFNYEAVSTFEPIIKNIELVPIMSGSVAVLKNIFFDFDKYELKEKSVTELQKVIRFLNQNPNVKIEISGHTDNMGNAAYNQQLSEKRAQSVFNYLISNGISSSRLSAKGFGQTQPLDTNDTEEGRQNNRRIEFKIR